jgi:hypothetical protein
LARTVGALRRLARFRRGFAFGWRPQLYAGAARFRQPDCNGLFGRARSVLSFANMMHFFAYELARLRAGGFALARIFARSLHCFFLWHNHLS